MTDEVRGVVELEIIPLDPYYYVSRESGKKFSTKPFIMHSALYYALGILPTRFRVSEQNPSYQAHFEEALSGDSLYIHPAQARGGEQYATRRFAVKGDSYRTEAVQENKNLLETGHQRFIEPDARFQTFALCREDLDPTDFDSRVPTYVRVGKKMTTARVRTALHETASRSGTFELGQPIGRTDIQSDQYRFVGGIRTEPMAPVDLITDGTLEGPHVRIEPEFGSTASETITLPTNVNFLGISA